MSREAGITIHETKRQELQRISLLLNLRIVLPLLFSTACFADWLVQPSKQTTLVTQTADEVTLSNGLMRGK